MKPEYWDKIAEFIADIIKIKNENILSLNQTLEIKNQELSNQTNQIHNLNETLNFQNNYGKAKTRIQNQLSYKLGQALIINSKSVLGFLSLPFIILSIVISHKQEQKAYKFKIKKNSNLALPPLETYPDYNEALKEKECFTYKLGEEFIKASKNWYGGGYIKFYFKDVPRLKREYERKR
ncbi:alpha-2,3-sialyltransferase [Campylobacter jejuni]|nr:alpha-2,3-sialyltransferase [Campylobacter jejuni]OEW63362.1 alpha-2,3-sialyltransferase [Campylobacter jejuni]